MFSINEDTEHEMHHFLEGAGVIYVYACNI